MKKLYIDRSTSSGIQVMELGETGFDVISNAVKADLFEDGDDASEVVIMTAKEESAWVMGTNPSVPATLDDGHYMVEGGSYPVVIKAGMKIAVKGTIALSW